ncbi:hypothetical protein [Armatimonas sp.]|uniref:hypothetical protein n=1 Tax=Armatimonas sp. TaxID=1872638 RepID=UPI00375398AC
MNHITRRVSYVFLCTLPILDTVAMVRGLRIPGVYQAAGGLLFAAVVVAAWILGAQGAGSSVGGDRRPAVAGALLMVPFALVSVLWVGLSGPWDATPAENLIRYLVLLGGLVGVTSGFIVLGESLRDAGERLYSTLGFSATLLGGPAYLIWLVTQIGGWSAKMRTGHIPPTLVSLSDVFDTLLFVAGALAYLSTAAFVASLGRTGWLGRGATRAYVILNLVALLFLMTRGLSFPDPTVLVTPWYTRPGFIAGIPIVPWIMPFLLGVTLLRRAGDEQKGRKSG